MMDEKALILIPIYKTQPNEDELFSLRRTLKILGNHPMAYLKPAALNTENYLPCNMPAYDFEDHYFTSIAGYNQLLLSTHFYERFLDYEYILICQLDCYVFSDQLNYWLQKKYNYIGAPWLFKKEKVPLYKIIKEKLRFYLHQFKNKNGMGALQADQSLLYNQVGNGGFSLRKTEIFHQLSIEFSELIHQYTLQKEIFYNEDVFFCVETKRQGKSLNIPDYQEAIYFSMENHLPISFKITQNQPPFACHAWDLHKDFWVPIFNQIELDSSKLAR